MQIPLRRPVICLFLSTIVMGGLLVAQQKPVVPPTGERAEGLLVDFLALTRDGRPVPDLAAGDVDVRINGRVRPIKSLRLMRVDDAGGLGAAVSTPIPPPYGANTHTSSPGGRRVVFAIDDDSFRAGSEGPLRQAINGLIAELGPRDQVLLVTMPYGGVKVPFTEDHGRVMSAIASLSGQRAQNESGSEMACRTRRLLQSLSGFLETLGGDDTPATVVFFTSGLAGPRRDALTGKAPGMCELEVRTFQEVGLAAGAARAAFYVVYPDDLPRSGNNLGSGALGSDNPIEGIEHLAGVTGGHRLPLLAVGDGALGQIARETSAYYVAEIAPERSDFNGDSRQLNVRVSRPDVVVRARPSITFAAPRPLAARRTIPTVHQMLLVTEEFADLPMRVAGYTTQGPGGKIKVVAVAETGDPSALLAAAAMALIDSTGRVVAQATSRDAAEIPLATALVVEPGTYRLRVAATDTTGRVGTADTEVTAALTPAGPLQLSALVLGLSRNGELTPRLQFSDEPSAIGSFELYGSAPEGLRVSAVLDVARSVDGPALASSRLALERAADDRLIATGAVPIGALPPGDYVVRGTIGVEGGPSGRVIRTIRKVSSRQ